MANHPALVAGRAAVITGAAGGIGFAAATKFARLGMKSSWPTRTLMRCGRLTTSFRI